MTTEDVAGLRQQALVLRAQVAALLMSVEAILTALPAPQGHEEDRGGTENPRH